MALGQGEISQTFHEQSLLSLTQRPQFPSQHSFSLPLSNKQLMPSLELSGYETPTNAHENPYFFFLKKHSDYSVFQVFPVSTTVS